MTASSWLLRATAAGMVAATGLGAAGAQDGCGSSYTVQPGDTLARIAERCDTSIDALLRANEQIENANRIDVGWEIAIPGGDARPARETAPADDDRALEQRFGGGETPEGAYTVQSGDTLAGIAATLGLSLFDLLAENEGVDPFGLQVGQQIRLPRRGETEEGDDAPAERLTLEGRVTGSGDCALLETPDGDVWALVSDVHGLTDGDYVEVGGPRVDDARCGRRTVQVTAIEESAPPQDEPERVTLEGRVTGSGNCALLETPDGDIWALVSERHGITGGEYVEVSGPAVDEGRCGRQTIEVVAIDEVSSPQERQGFEGDEQLALEGRVESGTECPLLRTPDGAVYSLISDDISFTPGEYVEIEGETVDMSFCMQGTTVRVTEIREMPAP